MLATKVIILKKSVWHARIQKIFPVGGGGGGGGGSKFPEGENFNMAKTNNLAIPVGGGRGGEGGGPPVPPLWIRPCLDSKYYRNNLCKQVELMSEFNCTK